MKKLSICSLAPNLCCFRAKDFKLKRKLIRYHFTFTLRLKLKTNLMVGLNFISILPNKSPFSSANVYAVSCFLEIKRSRCRPYHIVLYIYIYIYTRPDKYFVYTVRFVYYLDFSLHAEALTVYFHLTLP